MHSIYEESDSAHLEPEDLEMKISFIGTVGDAIVAGIELVL